MIDQKSKIIRHMAARPYASHAAADIMLATAIGHDECYTYLVALESSCTVCVTPGGTGWELVDPEHWRGRADVQRSLAARGGGEVVA